MPGRPPPPSAHSPEDLLAVGVIRKAHGVRGEASVESLTASLDRFGELARVFLVAPDGSVRREATVDGARTHGDRALVHFKGIDTPEEIRALRNWTIEIPQSEARRLEEGEFFLHDLLGLTVVDETGSERGRVADLIELPWGILLIVETGEGSRFEMPFAREICRNVDLEAKRLEVSLPEGLADLDSVTPVEEEVFEEMPEQPPVEEARRERLLRIDVVTIFPRIFDAVLEEGVIARAVRAGILDLRVHDLRDFATDRHRSTDDEPFGGGGGMVMLAEPVWRCVDAIRASGEGRPHVVMMSPQGAPFEQRHARQLAGRGWLVLLAGRYEGFDERIREALVDEELSVGDFVVSGGEIPAMLVIDAVSRMVEGVVGSRNSVESDSFYNGLLDYPHYTRPAEWRGMSVPEVLVSGHAENIRKWRKEQAIRATLQKRPELLERSELDEEAKRMLEKVRREDAAGERAEPDVDSTEKNKRSL